MERYLNINGTSSIVSYETTIDSIHVVFESGRFRNYLYNHARPGKQVVDRMKALAAQGFGLTSYIGTTVRAAYARKW